MFYAANFHELEKRNNFFFIVDLFKIRCRGSNDERMESFNELVEACREEVLGGKFQ